MFSNVIGDLLIQIIGLRLNIFFVVLVNINCLILVFNKILLIVCGEIIIFNVFEMKFKCIYEGNNDFFF